MLLEESDIGDGEGDAKVDPEWGEPSLTPTERLYDWNGFAVLALKSGNADQPVNAIQLFAEAVCQCRYIVGFSADDMLKALRRHLDENRFGDVSIEQGPGHPFVATRHSHLDSWVSFIIGSMEKTTRGKIACFPNLGASIPNDAFAEVLKMPTIWVPHSYPQCLQHGPNEHGLEAVFREGLAMMGGLFWDLGSGEELPAGRGGKTDHF